MYNTLKFIHIVSVIVWIGGMIMLTVLNGRLAKSGPPEAVRALGQQSGALSMTLFLLAVLLTVISGIGLVQVGRLGFGQKWILWGIIGAVVSFIDGRFGICSRDAVSPDADGSYRRARPRPRCSLVDQVWPVLFADGVMDDDEHNLADGRG